MNLPRIVPCLLTSERGLHKTRRFADSRYVGDPINAVRIFNEKEVDEIVVLRTDRRAGRLGPDFDEVRRLASECFMPLAYGGGVRTVDDVAEIFAIGVEKVVLNTAAIEDPGLVAAAAARHGAQAIVVSCDVRRDARGECRVFSHAGGRLIPEGPEAFCRRMQGLGAGEILLCAVDRDGTREGYDLDLVGRVARAVDVPVVAVGGAGSLEDCRRAIVEAGAAAAAAGSLFVFYGRRQAVLITYPERAAREAAFGVRA